MLLCADGYPAARADDLTDQRQSLAADYVRQLTALADRADGNGQAQLAARIRDWSQPRDPQKLYLISLPDALAEPPTAPPAGEDQAAADGETAPASATERDFWGLRTAQGDRLYELGREAMRARHASLAYELMLEALHENPDHEPLRKLLGYTRYDGGWQTRYEIAKLKAGQVWHPTFGWLPAANVARYEQGERFYNGRWISAEEDTRLRADIRRAWRIETEHYSIRTNLSLEAGVALGKRLERLYAAWQQVFLGFYATGQQIDRWFAGRGFPRVDESRHLVMYFRNRDEYRNHLAGKIPPDVETTGIYLGDQRTAFFFAPDPGEPADFSTLYHEASHQLFSESRPVVPDIGRTANFWIVEGIACYFESLAEHQGYYTLGGAAAQRLQAARYRAIEDSFYVPLAELSRYGMRNLQQDPRIATLYSQSAGLTHFLIHYDAGRYRDALVAYLVAVYTGRATPTSLAELTGESFDTLDVQYRQFLRELPVIDEPVAEAQNQ